jgi:tetratricopeptide (TPR) repeat protein
MIKMKTSTMRIIIIRTVVVTIALCFTNHVSAHIRYSQKRHDYPITFSKDTDRKVLILNYNGYTMAKGNCEKAISFFKKAIELDPFFVPAYSNLGKTYRNCGNYQQALVYLERSHELAPGHAVILLNLSELYLQLSRFDKAEKYALEAINRRDDYCEAYHLLGYLKFRTRSFKEASELLEKALRFSPHDVVILNNAGVAASHAGFQKKAIQYLEQAKKITPNDSTVVYNLGVTYLFAKQRSKAIDQYAQIKHMNKELAEVLYDGIIRNKTISIKSMFYEK